MPSKPSSPLLTPEPELARQLGISDQTVRRWQRAGKVPFRLSAQGWPMTRLDEVPSELLEFTKKLSSRRWWDRQGREPTAEEARAELQDEIAYLRTQLERALEIIKRLSSDNGTAHDG